MKNIRFKAPNYKFRIVSQDKSPVFVHSNFEFNPWPGSIDLDSVRTR